MPRCCQGRNQPALPIRARVTGVRHAHDPFRGDGAVQAGPSPASPAISAAILRNPRDPLFVARLAILDAGRRRRRAATARVTGVRVAGLDGDLRQVFRIWLDDTSPGLDRTMAALDRKLRPARIGSRKGNSKAFAALLAGSCRADGAARPSPETPPARARWTGATREPGLRLSDSLLGKRIVIAGAGEILRSFARQFRVDRVGSKPARPDRWERRASGLRFSTGDGFRFRCRPMTDAAAPDVHLDRVPGASSC